MELKIRFICEAADVVFFYVIRLGSAFIKIFNWKFSFLLAHKRYGMVWMDMVDMNQSIFFWIYSLHEAVQYPISSSNQTTPQEIGSLLSLSMNFSGSPLITHTLHASECFFNFLSKLCWGYFWFKHFVWIEILIANIVSVRVGRSNLFYHSVYFLYLKFFERIHTQKNYYFSENGVVQCIGIIMSCRGTRS